MPVGGIGADIYSGMQSIKNALFSKQLQENTQLADSEKLPKGSTITSAQASTNTLKGTSSVSVSYKTPGSDGEKKATFNLPEGRTWDPSSVKIDKGVLSVDTAEQNTSTMSWNLIAQE